ncbi:hypothetical protein Bbelb_276840 [Branchiostoma belcheri]|nr:hypothetical protein Bbelb_276840 [Branchiostoma belcheri]
MPPGGHLEVTSGTPGSHLEDTWRDAWKSLGSTWKSSRETPGSHLGDTLKSPGGGDTWMPPGSHLRDSWKSPGSHLRDTWKSPGGTPVSHLRDTWNHLGDNLEVTCGTPGSHLRDTWKSPVGHLEVTWRTPGSHLEDTWKSLYISIVPNGGEGASVSVLCKFLTLPQACSSTSRTSTNQAGAAILAMMETWLRVDISNSIIDLTTPFTEEIMGMVLGVVFVHTFLYIDGHALQEVSVAKMLGVMVQSDLKWNTHVNHITSQSSRRLFLLRHLKRFRLPVSDLVTVYVSYVRPLCEYACPVWGQGLTPTQTTQIENIQRQGMSYHTWQRQLRYLDACSLLGLPSLQQRLQHLILKFGRGLMESPTFRQWLPPT